MQKTIGDILMVSSERMAVAEERHDMCWYRTQVRVEPCTHEDHTYSVSGNKPTDTHTEVCSYCTTPFEPEQHQVVDGKCTVCGTEIDSTTGVSLIDNGQLTIDHYAGAWFDLFGRKLSGKPTAPGIYINNGNKVVIE